MRLLSVYDVAECLGIRPATVYRWAQEQRLPSVKIGSLIRFREKDIEDFVEMRFRPAKVCVEPGQRQAKVV